VSGSNADPNEYPWQVGLTWYDYNTHWATTIFCGGTLVAAQYVLTAAHCLYDLDDLEVEWETITYLLTVVVGDHSTDDWYTGATDELFQVASFTIHPNYDNETFDNDYAIIQLSRPVTFGPAANAACLPRDHSDQFVGQIATASGWGLLEG
jgi:trypsin